MTTAHKITLAVVGLILLAGLAFWFGTRQLSEPGAKPSATSTLPTTGTVVRTTDTELVLKTPDQPEVKVVVGSTTLFRTTDTSGKFVKADKNILVPGAVVILRGTPASTTDPIAGVDVITLPKK